MFDDSAVEFGTDPVKLREGLQQFSLEDLLFLRSRLLWRRIARKKQVPPKDEDWDFYGVKSGRGFGKTLAAAQWLWQQAAMEPESYNFVIAPTHEDLLKVCFYGPTGLHGSYYDKELDQVYPIIPPQLIRWATKSPLAICLWNGSLIQGFSADTPERLRGPQCHRAWCDEVASWRYPDKAWDNLIMGLRLGSHPRIFWTGTPKPKPFIRNLVKLPRSIIIHGSTYENRENLARTFFENVAKYEGTSVGRQELYGEILDPEEAGFVKRSQWRLWPALKKLPKFRFIIMSLDTAFTEKQWDKREQTGDPTACSVWGLFTYERTDHIMLLDAWEDYLGFPQLIKRIKIEKSFTYGDQDEPVLRPLLEKQRQPKHQGRPPDLILLEDKGSGISLRQQLAVEHLLTESYNPEGMDKLSRLHACSPLFPHGRVWAVESTKARGEPRNWADPLISQVCTYVGEGSLIHDDLLDSATQAWIYLMHRFDMKFTVRMDPKEETKKALEKLHAKKRRNPYDGRGR
jgi:phage terminase large subunit-like protein